MKRYENALLVVNPGAVNPSGICHSIIEACAEIREEGGGTVAICRDPAIRLMVYQLGELTSVRSAADEYSELVRQCEYGQGVSS